MKRKAEAKARMIVVPSLLTVSKASFLSCRMVRSSSAVIISTKLRELKLNLNGLKGVSLEVITAPVRTPIIPPV